MRVADPSQPVHQVVVVRRKSGCLRAFVIGVLVFLVLGAVLVDYLNANDRAQKPAQDLSNAAHDLDMAYESEVDSRNGTKPSEDWLPQVRERFYGDRDANISRGKSPTDDLLLITAADDRAYACYDVSALAYKSHKYDFPLGKLTTTPQC